MPPLLSLEGCASLLYKCKQRVSRTHALSLLACMLGSGLYVHHSVGGNHLLTLLLDTKHCLQPARHLFSRLPHRDKSSWNMIIIGHSNHSHSRELLSLYKHIPTEEFPNICSSAFVSLLKVCIELKDIDAGSEIHSHIAATGLHATDVYVGSALINMYAKCGSVLQAEEVFKCLSIRNIVSWNALITAYIDHGFTQKAINCFEKMQHEGVYPDTVTLICMLKACDGTELASRGYELHMEISQRGLDRDLHIGSSLVHMYAKAGSLDDARKVFHGIAVRDVTLWTSLMMGYADDGKHEEAINCYKKMQSEQISPNSVTYPCILKACSIMREIGQGQLIHKDIEIKGEKNTTVGNALINLYASCLLLAEAEHVFNTLQEWDQVSWNVLIGAFSNQGYPIEAIQYFFQMLIMGYSPDAVTFMYILKACSNLACSHGRTIHAEMVKRGMECELLSSSSLIDFYASHGLLKEAQDTFDKLSDIDVVSWTVLIAGYVDHGLGEHALESFDCMRLKSFSPAPVTLESCLKASASLGAMTKVHEFHAEITRRGWQKGVIIESSLVDSYAKCGCMLEAQSVFDKASCRNVVTWSALIAGYAQNGAIQNVVCTLKNMFLEGMQPNSVTISSILSACSHAGALEEAHVFYETLKDHYNFSEHITCMLDFFCRAGQFESAITLLDQMPFYPCSMVWRNIVGACQKQGNVELGMHVIEHAIHIDKQNTALYMNILNMFSHVHS